MLAFDLLPAAVAHVCGLTHAVCRMTSILLVFFVSAVFHELVLGVPLHMVRFWAFLGIILQVGCMHRLMKMSGRVSMHPPLLAYLSIICWWVMLNADDTK
jgi:ABC-type amino acid transport system permease subunit